MEKKLKITSAKQFQTLISELEKNPILARGFHRGTTPNSFKHDWDEIATTLNSVGPPVRDTDGWQKVWRDFKFKVKKKLTQKEAESNSTCGERLKRLTLLPLEEAAANLIQFQKQLNTKNQVSICESPITIKTENLDMPDADETILEEEEFIPSPVEKPLQEQVVAAPNRKRKKLSRNKNERHEFLEKVCSEMSDAMIEVGNALNDYSRYQQKLWEVEEKKLKMIKRRHEREEQLFEAEMKLKSIKIKIKTKELEILEKKSIN